MFCEKIKVVCFNFTQSNQRAGIVNTHNAILHARDMRVRAVEEENILPLDALKK